MSCYEIVVTFFKLFSSCPALTLLALYCTFTQVFCISYSEAPMIGLTRRPETSVNFKHMIPPSNPETPDSTTYHRVSLKSHFNCVVMPKDVWHNHKIWDISHSVGAVIQGATRNILCIKASSWSASLLPDALAQYMFLLNTALFSPSYFYCICVLILLRTNKLDRTVKAFGGSWFEFRPEHQLPSLIFSWFSSVCPAKCRDGTTDFLPHFFRPIFQYCTITGPYLVLLLRASGNKLQFVIRGDKRYRSLVNRVSCRITL